MLGYACPVGPTRTMLMTSSIETVELEGTRDGAPLSSCMPLATLLCQNNLLQEGAPTCGAWLGLDIVRSLMGGRILY